ncbi:hypothetical protein [Prescottella agglutinans]|uniref:hypothetical protein n=1 Tax=Prescottella agglutinans TaxID=1644129 RepID=UPI00247515F3|nr:hypothetical protein [Prescottella agglutinans]
MTAAVRETFEECGVLLADGPGGTPITRVGGDQWELEREAIADHRMSLAELFDRHELTLRSDLLQPWSLWVTPEFEPRRYHTWFMAARLPIGQEATPGASEAVSNEWYAIEDALRACDAGTLPMLPPQYCTLLELHGFNSVESIFTAERQVPTVRPALGRDADGGYLILPDRLVELGLRIGAQMYRDNEEQR